MSRTVQNVRKTYIEQTPYKVFDAHVELDEKTIEAPSFGTSTLSYAPDSPSSRAYRRLVDEILELF